MTFQTAVKTCFSKFLTFDGRASRPEYWWFFLFVVLADLAASLIDGLIFGFATEGEPGRHPTSMIVGFVTFFPALAAGWRRMHDSGRPGWFILLPSLIFLGSLVFLMIGIAGFGLIESLVADPEQLRGFAAILGASGVTAAAIAAIAAAIAKLWWLTRPSDPSANDFGAAPA